MRIALAWLDLADPTDRAIGFGLASELRKLGHHPLIVGPKRRSGEPSHGSVAGIEVHRLGPARSAAVPRLLDIHKRRKIDVWHCHVVARDHASFIEASRRAQWPLIVSVHTILHECLEFIGGIAKLHGLLGPAHRIVLPSRMAREEFLRLAPRYSDRTSVIPCGLPKRAAPSALPLKVRAPFALSIGRLAPYKGQDLLLMAFAKAREQVPDIQLVLSGRDQQRGALRQFGRALGLDGSVQWTGELGRPELQALLDHCLCFILPSRRETFSLATLEAMAAGKAVIASKTGAIPEMLRDGKDGIVIGPGDIEGMTRAIVRLCGDGKLRRRLGAAARARSRRFTWKRAASAYLSLYREAIASRNPG